MGFFKTAKKIYIRLRDFGDVIIGRAARRNSYIRIEAAPEINAPANRFSVDGEVEHRMILGTVNAFLVEKGSHTIDIFSDLGQWQITEEIGRGEVLIIKVELEDGNISHVMHAKDHAGMTAILFPPRL